MYDLKVEMEENGMHEQATGASMVNAFATYLRYEEKSRATSEKYVRDVRAFLAYAAGREITRELAIRWKEDLEEKGYAVRSINSMLAALNSFLKFTGKEECRVKPIRVQREAYSREEKELTRSEYFRLLKAAEGQPQLKLVLETICGTGIRVSELKYITVEAVRCGRAEIHCKGKIRIILVTGKLKKLLLTYARKNHIRTGPIFVTRNGNPLNRSNIWAQMKKLCKAANVSPGKVFPHNLRKLFARTFYRISKDLSKLADVLGHSNVNTTRIYIMTTGTEHMRQMEKMCLVI